MLIGLAIRDVVLIERLDLAFGEGLTVLTGETGAGKSIILGALGLALGARADAAMVRRGASQASATASFVLSADNPAWALLAEKGIGGDPGEDLVLRRTLAADGRSRAFVGGEAVNAALLRELGDLLLETHGQHETVGLLDVRTHRPLLDAFAGLGVQLEACAEAWRTWRAAIAALTRLEADQASAAAERDELAARLEELDRLQPQVGEEAALAEERATLAAAERAIGDIAAAREMAGGETLSGRLGQAFRALARARERALGAGLTEDAQAPMRLEAAAQAVDRALIEAGEAASAIDAAAEAFVFDPGRLEAAESRLFALRSAARRLALSVDELPAARADLAARLLAIESAADQIKAAGADCEAARLAYRSAAGALTKARGAAGARLSSRVAAELAPLRLGKARFRVAVEPLTAEREGPAGADRVEFEIATLEEAPFAPLGSIASGGELSRLALALKAVLCAHGADGRLLIFDEVDQGVGGAVADAVGQRLARLAQNAQVVVVTHSPQIAARANDHWRVSKTAVPERIAVEVLTDGVREEEIARMLSGEAVTDAARAAARSLMDA